MLLRVPLLGRALLSFVIRVLLPPLVVAAVVAEVDPPLQLEYHGWLIQCG